MDTVGKPQGLVRRKSTWYFRLRVPSELVSRFGAEKWQSLRTSDYREALTRLAEATATWQAAFSQARRENAEHQLRSVPVGRPATDADALRLARRYFRREAAEIDGVTRQGLHFEEVDAIEEDLGSRFGAFLDPEHPDTLMATGQVADDLLSSERLHAEPGGGVRRTLLEYLRRALLQLVALEKARFEGNYEDRVADSAFANSASETLAGSPRSSTYDTAGPTLADTAVRFLHEVVEVTGPTPKTLAKRRATMAHLVSHFGGARSIAEITRSECTEFRDTIADLPPHFTKRFKEAGLTLRSLAEHNSEGARGRMAYDTQNTYVGLMARFFGWAFDEGLISQDVARNLAPRARKVPREDQRDPFTGEELKAIFGAPLYTGSMDDGQRFAQRGPHVIRRARFWLPLLGLYTGLRMGEILQLGPEDIRTSPGGVPFVLLHRDMRLKNPGSVREMPIHSDLRRIGLLRFVEEKRKAGAKRLFDEIAPASDGYASGIFSKRFGTFSKSVGIKKGSGEQTFHSFRHNFRDALRRGGVSEERAEELGGWSRGKKASRSYGAGFDADTLGPEIDKVRFPSLDLAHLYVLND